MTALNSIKPAQRSILAHFAPSLVVRPTRVFRLPLALALARSSVPSISQPSFRRSFATSPTPLPNPSASPVPNPSLSQRLKALFRTHGWSALVVYLALSLLDFSLTFVLIYAVGADKVRVAEDWVLDALAWRRKDGEPGKIKRAVEEWTASHHLHPNGVSHADAEAHVNEVVKEAAATTAAAHNGYSTMATTAVLAYAIHKTLLLPVRIGVTVAITPRIVRTLQSWGWKVGLNGGAAGTAGTVASAVGKSTTTP